MQLSVINKMTTGTKKPIKNNLSATNKIVFRNFDSLPNSILQCTESRVSFHSSNRWNTWASKLQMDFHSISLLWRNVMKVALNDTGKKEREFQVKFFSSEIHIIHHSYLHLTAFTWKISSREFQWTNLPEFHSELNFIVKFTWKISLANFRCEGSFMWNLHEYILPVYIICCWVFIFAHLQNIIYLLTIGKSQLVGQDFGGFERLCGW